MELSAIQERIRETLEEFETLRNVDQHLLDLEAELKESYDKLRALDKVLDKELKDIESLEKLGVKSLFLKTLGNKEKQLEKERQDYLEASLKYKDLKQSVELLEFERDVLKKKTNRLPVIKKELEQLKESRKAEILARKDSAIYNELKEILHLSDVAVMLNKELVEAIEEGEKSMTLLAQLARYLEGVREWGTWNTGGRRGMHRSGADKALRHMSKTQQQLNSFTRELRDLGENNIVFKLDMSHFKKFSNFFFDNLISDWIIMQRIKSTLNNIESTYAHVHRIVLSLKKEKTDNQQKMIFHKSKIDNLLMR